MLAAESLCFCSWQIAAWMVAFFLGATLTPWRVEEPVLEQHDVVAFQEVENEAALAHRDAVGRGRPLHRLPEAF